MKANLQDIDAAAREAAVAEMLRSAEMIEHCVGQLTDSQLWWRGDDTMNSVANLVLHIVGNIGQWIVASVGGHEDVRDRPREFAEQGPIAGELLIERLHRTVADARRVIESATPDEMLRRRNIQTFHVTGMGAVIHSVVHLQGHTQEIIHIARSLLGKEYKFAVVIEDDNRAGGESRV